MDFMWILNSRYARGYCVDTKFTLCTRGYGVDIAWILNPRYKRGYCVDIRISTHINVQFWTMKSRRGYSYYAWIF